MYKDVKWIMGNCQNIPSPLPPEETGTTENISLPQCHWRAVKKTRRKLERIDS